MRRRVCLRLAAVLLALHGTVHAGIIDPGPEHLWVGFAGNCTHNNIQAAIDAASPTRGAIVHIVGAQWNAIGLVVQDKDIALQGGHVACLDQTQSGRTTLSNTPLAGPTGTAVLTVLGNATVSASRIEFTNGGQGTASHDGGGIRFDGSGRLMLADAVVRDNVARNGGGIWIRAFNGPVLLDLLEGTRIVDNSADSSGGGIHLEGIATLLIRAPDVTIAHNQAGNHGGGLNLADGATAAIGSWSSTGEALFEDNAAARGGAVAVRGQRVEHASSLRIFAIHATRPTLLRGNVARYEGGAILAGAAVLGEDAPGVQVCVSDTRFESNIANDGAIVFAALPAEARGGGTVVQRPPTVQLGAALDAAGCPGNAAASGAVACRPDAECNRYALNLAVDPMEARAVVAAAPGVHPRGGPTLYPGSLLTAGRGALLLVDRVVLHDNLASGPALVARGGTLRLRDSVVANVTSLFGPLLQVDEGSVAGVLQSTVANITVQAPVIANAGMAGVFDSILDVGTTPLLANLGMGSAEFVHVLSGNFDGADADDLFGTVVGQAQFVDRAAGNLRLAGDSLAIDVAPALPDTDPDGTPRNHDAPRANRFGTRDLGAYEWTPGFLAGRLFGDGFEAAPAR